VTGLVGKLEREKLIALPPPSIVRDSGRSDGRRAKVARRRGERAGDSVRVRARPRAMGASSTFRRSFGAATMPLVLRQPRTDRARRDAPRPGPLDGNGPSRRISSSFRGGRRGAAARRRRPPRRMRRSSPRTAIPKFLTASDATARPASSSGRRGCGGDPRPRRRRRRRTTGVPPTSSSGAI
jgi:hypothetical protein